MARSAAQGAIRPAARRRRPPGPASGRPGGGCRRPPRRAPARASADRGSHTTNVEPTPTADRTVTWPPWASVTWRAMVRPIPRPWPSSVDPVCAVEVVAPAPVAAEGPLVVLVRQAGALVAHGDPRPVLPARRNASRMTEPAGARRTALTSRLPTAVWTAAAVARHHQAARARRRRSIRRRSRAMPACSAASAAASSARSTVPSSTAPETAVGGEVVHGPSQALDAAAGGGQLEPQRRRRGPASSWPGRGWWRPPRGGCAARGRCPAGGGGAPVRVRPARPRPPRRSLRARPRATPRRHLRRGRAGRPPATPGRPPGPGPRPAPPSDPAQRRGPRCGSRRPTRPRRRTWTTATRSPTWSTWVTTAGWL